jgi:hypothetical protein
MTPRRSLLAFALLAASTVSGHATTLAPEIKAYDFARAYYLEDRGITLQPQDGFYCKGGTSTPEGLHLSPGQTFVEFDPARHIKEVYRFIRITPDERRAYFHEQRYHYKVVPLPRNARRFVQQEYIDSDDFYLTRFRQWQWLDGVFPDFEVHPGEELWRTRP